MTQTIHTPAAQSVVRRFHYRDSVYFQDGYWFTAILTGILYLILAAALDAAGHVSNLSVVIPVTAGAFVLGLLMSFSRFDGFFALSHSMFVGLAWILYSMARMVPAGEVEPFLDSANIGELQARVYFVLLRLLDWVDAAISRSASADNYVFIFEICFLVWWLTYLGVWSIFRYGYTWRAVVPAGVVLLINTYYAPRPTLGFLVAFVLVALVLLVRTNLSEQQLRWRDQRIYFQPDIVWDFLRNGILFSALLVMAAWVLPGLGRNPQVRALLQPVNATWEATAENVQRLYQGLNRQPPEAASSFGNSLTLGGERNVTDTPVFQAQASRARYWRAVVFDTYSEGRWLNTAEENQRFDPGEIAPIASWRARSAISQTITLLAPVGTVLFGMPDVAQSTIQFDAQIRTQAGAVVIPAAEAPANTQPVEFTMIRTNRELNGG
ncbi:MAG: transglutaminaseTgpA domain-containing protein, partial [Caldilinea sp.]